MSSATSELKQINAQNGAPSTKTSGDDLKETHYKPADISVDETIKPAPNGIWQVINDVLLWLDGGTESKNSNLTSDTDTAYAGYWYFVVGGILYYLVKKE